MKGVGLKNKRARRGARVVCWANRHFFSLFLVHSSRSTRPPPSPPPGLPSLKQFNIFCPPPLPYCRHPRRYGMIPLEPPSILYTQSRFSIIGGYWSRGHFHAVCLISITHSYRVTVND